MHRARRTVPRIALPALLALAVLLLPLAGAATPSTPAPYTPRPGDAFSYTEEIVLAGGTGNYTGYTEHNFINGSIAVHAVAANASVTTEYASTGHWFNNTGASEVSSEQGWFGFSYATFLYVNGTDNQTGYDNPSVWFFIANTVAVGSSVTLLNTAMTVDATAATIAWPSSPTGYIVAIQAEGNGTFQRDDIYGDFSAAYTWTAWFDPSTGYIVAYQYVEHDSDGAGDGFTWTDDLTATSTTFPLTAATAPTSPSSGNSNSELLLIAIVAVVVVVIIVLVVALALRARRRRSGGMAAAGVPRHGAPGAPGFQRTFAPPPPVSLIPSGQPPVQQIVIKETVKVPCRYCGTLMDSTATVCPNCGAPRT